MRCRLRFTLILALLSAFCRSSTARDEPDKIGVECSPTQMKVSIEKDLIPDFLLGDLTLRETDCLLMDATQNASHFVLSLPLTACGTKVEHTTRNVIYSNVVKDRPAGADAVIIRLQALEIPFKCVYSNKGSSSTAELSVLQPSVVEIRPNDGSGQFSLKMTIFKDASYAEAFAREDFPIAVSLNSRLYFQVSADTPDGSLSVIADTCYATPTASASNQSRYDIFLDGCIKDSTVKIHPHPLRTYRFSFATFQFVNGKAEPYVFVHCSVALCDSTDRNSRCSKGNRVCNGNGEEPRKRRRLRREAEKTFELEEGPIVLLRDGSASGTEEQAQGEWDVSAWLLVTMAVICVGCLATVAYTRWQLHLARRSTDV